MTGAREGDNGGTTRLGTFYLEILNVFLLGKQSKHKLKDNIL